MLKKLPFSLNVPVNICAIKLNFHISELLRASGSDCVSAPHNHGDFEMRYLASGSANQIIKGEDIFTRSGDIILLHPGETHYQTEEATTSNLVQYSIRISIKNTTASSAVALYDLFMNLRKVRDDRYILAPLFNRLWKEINDRKIGYFNYLQSLCQSIIIEFLRLSGKDCDEILTVDGTKYTSYWHDRLDSFLHNHYMEDIKLEDLASDISLSSRHASRMVTREYGMSFIAKLTEIRIDNAKYQLKHTKKSLSNIASSCGFASYSYFTSCFKKNVGMTPGEYRAKFKSK